MPAWQARLPMRATIAFLLVACAVAWLALGQSSPTSSSSGKDETIPVEASDAEMNAAIETARKSIGDFWRQFEDPDLGVDGFALKVRILDGETVEHFWLIEIERSAFEFSGIINNEPNSVMTVKLGQRYVFKEADISDWLFRRNGKIVGNETLRVLFKSMPPEEAAEYRAMLETP